MTRVDLTRAQCAELANYLRGVLNNGMARRAKPVAVKEDDT